MQGGKAAMQNDEKRTGSRSTMKKTKQSFPKNEDAKNEFKRSFNTPVIETLVAFANTKGGSVYIGIGDNGLPSKEFKVGRESIANWINEIKNKTQPALVPDVELLETESTQIVKFSVSEFPVKPVSCRGMYIQGNWCDRKVWLRDSKSVADHDGCQRQQSRI